MAMYSTSTGVTSHRSMGIMQELQKYIAHVESLATHRKLEIDKLHEEKRDLEKAAKQGCPFRCGKQAEKRNDLRRIATRPRVDPTKASLLLRLPTDRPTSLKAPAIGDIRGDEQSQVKCLLEDIRVLKDRVRKYKERSQSGDRQIAAQQNQILRLQDRVATLENSLQAANRTELQISDEHKLQEEVAAKEKEIRDLNEKVKVAQRSREVDARRHKLEAQELRKETAGMKQEVDRLTAELEERNKEIRMDAMKIRSLRKKLDPIKRQLNEVTNQSRMNGQDYADSPTASINGRPFVPSLIDGADYSLASPGLDYSANASPRDTFEDAGGVELPANLTPRKMEAELRRLQRHCQAQQVKINQLRLEGEQRDNDRKAQIMDEGKAAVTIQKALRGYATRKTFQKQKSAAMRIQAQLRGHQVRKKLRQQSLEQEANKSRLTPEPILVNGNSELDTERKESVEEAVPVKPEPEEDTSARPSPTKELLRSKLSGVVPGSPKTGGAKSPGSGKGTPKRQSSMNGRNSPTVKRGARG